MAGSGRRSGWWLALAFVLAGCAVYASHRYVGWRADEENRQRLAQEKLRLDMENIRVRQILADEEVKRRHRVARLCAIYFQSHPEDANRADISAVSNWAVGKGLAEPGDFCSRFDALPYELVCEGNSLIVGRGAFRTTVFWRQSPGKGPGRAATGEGTGAGRVPRSGAGGRDRGSGGSGGHKLSGQGLGIAGRTTGE